MPEEREIILEESSEAVKISKTINAMQDNLTQVVPPKELATNYFITIENNDFIGVEELLHMLNPNLVDLTNTLKIETSWCGKTTKHAAYSKIFDSLAWTSSILKGELEDEVFFIVGKNDAEHVHHGYFIIVFSISYYFLF